MRNKLAAFAVLASLAAVPSAGADPFKVIVNAGVAGRAISKEALADIFLGRIERWGDGHAITPVDLTPSSTVRASFSQDILGQTVNTTRIHWLKAVGKGQYPPMTRSDDEAVIAFVSKNTGGIGYVSAAAELPPTVKAVAVQ